MSWSILSSFINFYCFFLLFISITIQSTVAYSLRNTHLQHHHCFKWKKSSHIYQTNSPSTEVGELSTMKVNELKLLLKQFGGKPGNLRKSELIEECSKYLSAAKLKDNSNKSSSSITAATSFLQTSTTEKTPWQKGGKITKVASNKKGKLRNMPPLVDKASLITASSEEEEEKEHHLQRLYKKNQEKLPSASFNNIRNTNKTQFDNFPIGKNRDERLKDEPHGDLELTFLGTASCNPTITRGVSCIAMRYLGDTWLFDCGESSQLQITKSSIRANKINKIFITHLHGDHAFGLAGVLCLIGQTTNDEREMLRNNGESIEPIDIYGPEGTRDMIRAIIQLSYSKIAASYRVHELKNIPFLHHNFSRPPYKSIIRTRSDHMFNECEGSDIYPDENGFYHLFDNENFIVKAAPMQHTIPCVGFVINEKNKSGTLRIEKIKDIVEKNKENLSKIPKYNRSYKKVYQTLKDLLPGENFKFPDGTIINAEDIVDPPTKGRKIVIMGDTCTGKYIEPLAKDADVLIHEATNAFIYELDASRHGSFAHLERDTIRHGHSTPQMAGTMASRIKAKKLILTHFSPRYLGDASEFSMKLMWRIENQARSTSGLNKKPNDVIAAWDHMTISIPSEKSITKQLKSKK